MHTAKQKSMGDLGFDDVEELRKQLGLSQTRLCQLSMINLTTYQRWLRHARGQEGGNCPHPRSLAAVQDALCTVLERQQKKAPNAGDPAPSGADQSVTAGEHGDEAGQESGLLHGTRSPDRAA